MVTSRTKIRSSVQVLAWGVSTGRGVGVAWPVVGSGVAVAGTKGVAVGVRTTGVSGTTMVA